MTLAAQALDHVFKPIKMNFQLLGNAVPHLHVHLVPRYYGDAAPAQPINPDMQVVHLTRTAFEAQIQAIRAAITPLMTA
jgi:diadenosine tetraphosphate (Ap4A) HIT family hydrolase